MTKVRKILKLMLPPIISKMRETQLRNRHFSGPYSTYAQALAQVKSDAFAGEVWEKHTRAKLLTPTHANGRVLPQHQVVLAALIGQLSMAASYLNRPIKVVDWGGGAGELFDVITSAVSRPAKLTYVVVDNARLIELGKRFRPAIRFVDFADESAAFHEAKDADILFMSSVLHYVPGWESFLQRIADECRPDLLYIARHYSPDALDAPVFATQKIYTGSGYAGEAVLHLLPEKCLAQRLSGQYGLVLSAVAGVPDYFPAAFGALDIRERNILFRRSSD